MVTFICYDKRSNLQFQGVHIIMATIIATIIIGGTLVIISFIYTEIREAYNRSIQAEIVTTTNSQGDTMVIIGATYVVKNCNVHVRVRVTLLSGLIENRLCIALLDQLCCVVQPLPTELPR